MDLAKALVLIDLFFGQLVHYSWDRVYLQQWKMSPRFSNTKLIGKYRVRHRVSVTLSIFAAVEIVTAFQ